MKTEPSKPREFWITEPDCRWGTWLAPNDQSVPANSVHVIEKSHADALEQQIKDLVALRYETDKKVQALESENASLSRKLEIADKALKVAIEYLKKYQVQSERGNDLQADCVECTNPFNEDFSEYDSFANIALKEIAELNGDK